MDEGTLKFFNRNSHTFLSKSKDCMIKRESTDNDWDYYRVYYLEEGKPDLLMYEFWYPKHGKTSKVAKPKHTGGKSPYLMLMVNEIESLRADGVKNVEELIGYIVCLGKYIEWNTGRLIKDKRRKKNKPLQYNDLLEIFKCSNNKLNKMLKLMKENNLLEHTSEGYFISQKYIKKGRSEGRD